MLQKEKSGRKLFRFSQTYPDSYERAADTVRKNKSVVGNLRTRFPAGFICGTEKYP